MDTFVMGSDNTGRKVRLSKDILAKLRCNCCEKYLSVPPIYSSENTNFCGRCTSSGVRNHLFEHIIKYIIFPCTYENCNEQLDFGSLIHRHELECPHRIIPCPLKDCTEEGTANTTDLHLENIHKVQKFNKFILQVKISGEELEYLFETDYNKAFLLIDEGTTFVAYILGSKAGSTIHDRVQVRFGVDIRYLLKDINVDKCDVRFLVTYNDGRATSEIFWQGDIQPFNEKIIRYENNIIDTCVVPSTNSSSMALTLQVYYKNQLNTLRCLNCNNIPCPDCKTFKDLDPKQLVKITPTPDNV